MSGTPEGRVELVEVAPRDGLQNDPADLPTEAKAELVRAVIAAGARRVEVTSFVSPRAVPKLADAERLVELLRRDAPEGVRLMGLVVNERGIARAAAAGVQEVNVVVVATDTFSRANQGADTAGTLARLPGLLEAARSAGLAASVTIGAAFGCPYEGEVPLGRLEEVAGQVAEAQPDELCLADTIGVAVPAQVTERVLAVRRLAPGLAQRCHFHDTRGTGAANAWAAYQAGVGALDAALGGIGGCPFAPGATGNVASEDLVYLFERSGVETGLDLGRLLAARRWLEQVLGHPTASALGRAGPFPPSRAAPTP
jgi:hydroxymethylglutaryl-CoA lyase